MIRRLFLACLLALLAGCSAVEFAYNNADSYLRWQAGRYLDLQDAQAEEFNERLAAFLAWHRVRRRCRSTRALPARRAGASSAAPRWRTWFGVTMPSGSRPGRGCAAPGADTGDFLDRLTPAQIEHLERRFAEDNRKFAREWLEGTPAEQRARRLKRLTHTLEDWLGELSDAQRERVRQFNEAAPLNGEMRDRERRRRQAELLAMLRARESARRLADWAAEWDRGPRSGVRRANREFADGLLAMLADARAQLEPAPARGGRGAAARVRARLRPAGRRAMNDRTAPPEGLRSSRRRATPGARASRSSSTRRCSPTPRSASPSRATASSSCATRSSPRCSAGGPRS